MGCDQYILSLADALDNRSLVWRTGGDALWFAQTEMTSDDADAAASGGIGNNAQSWLGTTVTNAGTVTFLWRVSSLASRDTLRFTVDGLACGLISGESGWQTLSVPIASGTHVLRWTYVKGKSGAAGSDRGWVDQVTWVPEQSKKVTLSEALDATNLTWRTGGEAPWFAQTERSFDGEDAAQSGGLSSNSVSWLQTKVMDGGTLSFEWRTSTEEDYDLLVFSVDGVIRRSLSGETGWEHVALALDTGAHVLRWEFWKDESESSGADAGWVDRVAWNGGVPPVTGFEHWAAAHNLKGDVSEMFSLDRDGDGVANAFEYTFGTNRAVGDPLILIRMVNGHPVVETPKQDTETLPYVDLTLKGCTNLPCLSGSWLLPIFPALDTEGKSANRDWYETQGAPPKAFFKLEATLK